MKIVSTIGATATTKRTLLIEPYSYVREKFEIDEHVAIYSGKMISCWSEDRQRVFSIGYPNQDEIICNFDEDIDDVKSKISENISIFYRWMGESDTYEDNQRSFLLFVLNLAATLSSLNIAQAIFFTGVAHHVEYVLIEIACRLAGVKQIFLYPMPFGASRLLPVVQDQSIEDRQFLGLDLSSFDLRQDLIAYRNNYLARGAPKNNEPIGGLALSRPYAYFKLIERAAREQAKLIVRRTPAPQHLIDRRKGYGTISMPRIINRQKGALDYYSSKAISNEETRRLIAQANPLPLVYAHYQPEASTAPEGGAISDHLGVALAIRKAGYLGKILYKEHPASWIYYSGVTGFSLVGIARSEDYYRQLEALGCVFVQPHFRPDDGMLRQVFPVTITGSIAVERSLTGWRTCCAGVPWFRFAPGVMKVSECFSRDGFFYDPNKWSMEKEAGIDWFDRHLSGRTITNYPGIGSGIGSKLESEKQDFLHELGILIDSMHIGKN